MLSIDYVMQLFSFIWAWDDIQCLVEGMTEAYLTVFKSVKAG